MTLASSPTLNSAGHTRFPTFSMMRTSISSSGSSETPERTMFASRWHSPPKPGSVFTCTSGTWKRARRSASSVVCTSPSRTPRRSLARRRSSVCSSRAVLPAPGELIMFTTKFPAWSNRARLAWASASLASRTPSITTCFTAVRCIPASLLWCRSVSRSVGPSACWRLLHLQRFHEQFLSLQDLQVEASARQALQGEALEPGLLPAIAAQAGGRDLLYLELGALDGGSLGHEFEAEGQGGGDDLAQVADLQVHLRYAASVRVAGGDPDYGLGYGQLVQALTPRFLDQAKQHMINRGLHLLSARDVVRAHDDGV